MTEKNKAWKDWKLLDGLDSMKSKALSDIDNEWEGQEIGECHKDYIRDAYEQIKEIIIQLGGKKREELQESLVNFITCAYACEEFEPPETKQAFKQIYELIQQSCPIPTTTGKEIFDFLDNLLTIQLDAVDEDGYRREIKYIKNWLKKIGVEVKDEK